MFLRRLRISTNIRLHSDFSVEPTTFARRYGVTLADDVYPETSFKRDLDDPESDGRIMQRKFNIHLVRHGAIRLLVERDKDHADWVRSIELNPSMLIYAEKKQPHRIGDLTLALNILSKQISPLLADPLDAQNIIPGLIESEEPIAFWSLIDSEIVLPEIKVYCLHGLSHPNTGPAEGVKEDRIQLGDKQDDCVIRFKEANWPCDGQMVEGTRVRLILKGRILTEEFKAFGTITKIDNTMRLLSFTESGIAHVHQAVMARTEGTYLPVPVEWRDRTKGKPLTHAKVIALTSCLTSTDPEEIRLMDEEIRSNSDSTRKRLKKDLPIECNRLVPRPVSSLFQPSAPTFPASGLSHTDDRIIPTIAEVYGER